MGRWDDGRSVGEIRGVIQPVQATEPSMIGMWSKFPPDRVDRVAQELDPAEISLPDPCCRSLTQVPDLGRLEPHDEGGDGVDGHRVVAGDDHSQRSRFAMVGAVAIHRHEPVDEAHNRPGDPGDIHQQPRRLLHLVPGKR